MRLVLLTALTMVAFAANSILNRMALAGGHIGPTDFGTIRLFAGAVMLAGLCVILRGGVRLDGPARATGMLALLVYMYGFSLAYGALDAGLGALILFGTVQITMFAGGLWSREAMPATRWIGAALALAGLAWLLWPAGPVQVSVRHGLFMAAAGMGWGIYSLAGRRADDALQATAANFILATPVGVVIGLALPVDAVDVTLSGVALAILSGAVTSGMGYALWYAILPRFDASIAAVAQLTVPVIAIAGGMLLLGEVLEAKTVLASALVLGGVAVSVLRRR
ncbi:MAG: DMT family transporter [Marinovum algicola]|uniref:DMT family transporter n=1 Tax=Marinovum algicola TaxID=42444 RepID=UPI0032EBAF40